MVCTPSPPSWMAAGGCMPSGYWIAGTMTAWRRSRLLAEKAGVKILAGPPDRVGSHHQWGERHQGVAAQAEGAELRDEGGLIPLLDGLDVPPFLLVLDGVQDPHNLGACLRSANAAGVHAVIAPKDKSAGLHCRGPQSGLRRRRSDTFFSRSRTWRAPSGSSRTGTSGLWVSPAKRTRSLYELVLKGPLAIVMGAEGEGMRRLTKEHCDFLAKIPMDGSVESLNVSRPRASRCSRPIGNGTPSPRNEKAPRMRGAF